MDVANGGVAGQGSSFQDQESARSNIRRKTLGRGVTAGRSTVLEIGPLDRPIFRRPEFDAKYVDHASAPDLRRKYAGDPNVGDIVDIDVIWAGSGSLADAAGGELFDCVIASHVIEHIPDPIGWLGQLASVVKPGGEIGLVVPDKRFTFDYNRRLTETSDLVDAYVRGATLPGCGQLYDFHTKALPVDAAAVWAGTVDYSGQVRPGDLRREALGGSVNLHENGGFHDIHCHTFTPESFVGLFADLEELELLPLRILEIVPTARNTIEFYVRLEHVGTEHDLEHRPLQDFTSVLASADQIAVPLPSPPVPTPAPTPPFQISDRERRLIAAKRRLVIGARRFWARGRD